jgi:hypothetical protein
VNGPATATSRDTRAVQLDHMTKVQLIELCRNNGISGLYPLTEWSKDDLISSILSAEFPAAPP